IKGRTFRSATKADLMILASGTVVENLVLPIGSFAQHCRIGKNNVPSPGYGSLVPQGRILFRVQQVQFSGRSRNPGIPIIRNAQFSGSTVFGSNKDNSRSPPGPINGLGSGILQHFYRSDIRLIEITDTPGIYYYTVYYP